MKKFVCSVCGYVYEGSAPPEVCPVCKAPASKFNEQTADTGYAAEHVVGVAKGVDTEVYDGLVANFNGECSEVGMYLAMSRVAEREGYPEVAEAYKRYAFEEAEHAAKFAELLGEVLTTSTKKNLELRIEAEHGRLRRQGRHRQEGQGTRLRRHPRYRPRDGQGRGAPRRRIQGTSQAVFQLTFCQFSACTSPPSAKKSKFLGEIPGFVIEQ